MQEPQGPPPLRGGRRVLALIWVAAIVLAYVVVRQQLGEGFFP